VANGRTRLTSKLNARGRNNKAGKIEEVHHQIQGGGYSSELQLVTKIINFGVVGVG